MHSTKPNNEILLIEDDKYLCESVKKHLGILGYNIYIQNRGDRGLEYFLSHSRSLDLAILDIHLPGMNGLDICHEVRTHGINIPIIILTCERSSETAVSAFDIGANDYVRKPFDLFELQARINSVLQTKKDPESYIFKIDNLVIDLNRRSVQSNGQEVYLRRKEFDLLIFLFRNRGKALTRDFIISNVWNFDDDPYPNTVDAHISILRKKLDEKEQIIETVFGIGYRMKGY